MADSFIQVPPDSSGKKLNTSEDTVNAQTVHTQRMLIAGGANVEQYANVDRLGALSMTFAEGTPTLDAFGRVITTSPLPQLLENFIQDDASEAFTQSTVGGGSIARVAQTSSLRLSVGTASGDIARIESNGIMQYVPALGMHFIATAWSGDSGKANVARRMGIFDDANGVFFELDGTTFNFVVRSSATGSVVDTKLAQATWDDPLDGTGKSGMTVNFTNMNIFWCDYQWLGGGAIRFGVYDPVGNRIVAHTVQNANSQPRPYMQTGSNRVRCEIENTGASGSSSEISVVCLAVYSDGRAHSSRHTYGDLFRTGLGVSGSGVYLGAARPKATYNGMTNTAVCVPTAMEVYSDQPVKLDIYFGVTSVTGGTFGLSSAGPIELDTAGSAIVGGRVIQSSIVDVGRTEISLREFSEYGLSTVNLWPGGIQPIFAFVGNQLGGSAATALAYTISYEELK